MRYLLFFSLVVATACSLPGELLVFNFDQDFISNKRVVFFLAHQDDDVFISPMIEYHVDRNDKIDVVFTCQSYFRGDDYRLKRVSEAYKALGSLGIDSTAIHFFDYPDTESYKYLNELFKSTDSLFKIISPDVVYTSAYEGGNVDHDICNLIVSEVFKNRPGMTCFEFPEYSGYESILPFKMRSFPADTLTHIERLSNADYKKVKEHWKYYESQHFPLGWYIALTQGKRVTFGHLYLRKLQHSNFLDPEFINYVAYEKYQNVSFDTVRYHMESFLEIRKE